MGLLPTVDRRGKGFSFPFSGMSFICMLVSACCQRFEIAKDQGTEVSLVFQPNELILYSILLIMESGFYLAIWLLGITFEV